MSVQIKTKKQIEGIRRSCRLAAATLDHVASFVRPDITTQALDDIAVKYITAHKAVAAPLNYGGYPKSICTSVNDVVCHGIPSTSHALKSGDIINIDITTILDGYFGDVSRTFPVGKVKPEAQLLIDRTRTALDLSIKALKPGKSLNACVGKVIEPYVAQFGYSVVRELGGHGVGLRFHEDPFVYHFDTHQDGTILKPGMVFTIEPMINNCPDPDVYIDKNDGWTVRSRSGCLSAQFEHTILITSSAAEVLTK